MLLADQLADVKTEIKYEYDGKPDSRWVIAKPLPQPFLMRLRDAIQVLKGRAEAVRFYKQ